MCTELQRQGARVRAHVRSDSGRDKLPDGVDETVVGLMEQFTTATKIVDGCHAVVSALGPTDRGPLSSFNVDYIGFCNVVAACKHMQAPPVQHVGLVSTIAADDWLFPLNLAGGVLVWKRLGELELERSGLTHTIVRPGGLTNDTADRGVTLAPQGTYGLPPSRQIPGSISRKRVAQLVVGAIGTPSARNKLVEAVSNDRHGKELDVESLFSSV